MLETGEIVELTNNKKYMVANMLELHNIKYVYLVTLTKPLEIVVATLKNIADSIVLEEVKDNEELDYILSQFAINTKIDN